MLLFRYKITEIYRQSHIKAKQMSRIFCRYSTLHTYICHIHDFLNIFIKELCLIKRTSILGKQHISEQTKPSCMLTCNNSMDNTMHSMTGQFWASWFALTIFEEKHMHKGTVGKNFYTFKWGFLLGSWLRGTLNFFSLGWMSGYTLSSGRFWALRCLEKMAWPVLKINQNTGIWRLVTHVVKVNQITGFERCSHFLLKQIHRGLKVDLICC